MKFDEIIIHLSCLIMNRNRQAEISLEISRIKKKPNEEILS
jgi:hypothetical protein